MPSTGSQRRSSDTSGMLSPRRVGNSPSPHARLALHAHHTNPIPSPHVRPSQWTLPMLLAFFVVSGLYEHSPTPVIWVEALAPAIVPAAVAVNVHFWARALTLKRRTHALACFALYIAHVYAGTTEALIDALPSSPAAHVEALKVLVNHVGMLVVLGLTASLPKAKVGVWANPHPNPNLTLTLTPARTRTLIFTRTRACPKRTAPSPRPPDVLRLRTGLLPCSTGRASPPLPHLQCSSLYTPPPAGCGIVIV